MYPRFWHSSNAKIHNPSSARQISPIAFTSDTLEGCEDAFGDHVFSTCLLVSHSLISVTLDFDLPVPHAFALFLVLMLVPIFGSFVTLFSTISTFTFKARVFHFRFSVVFHFSVLRNFS